MINKSNSLTEQQCERLITSTDWESIDPYAQECEVKDSDGNIRTEMFVTLTALGKESGIKSKTIYTHMMKDQKNKVKKFRATKIQNVMKQNMWVVGVNSFCNYFYNEHRDEMDTNYYDNIHKSNMNALKDAGFMPMVKSNTTQPVFNNKSSVKNKFF